MKTGESTEQKQFSSLNAFLKPPPTQEEIKKAKGDSELNTDKGPIQSGLLKP